MIFALDSSAYTANGWPRTWPPFKFPPPSPLSAAGNSLWSPQISGFQSDSTSVDTKQAAAPASSLYSTQLGLSSSNSGANQDNQGQSEMAFLDQRIALVRYDASHDNGVATPQSAVATASSTAVSSDNAVAA